MPDEKKVDPFKPQQPTIPGVSPSDGKPKPEAPPPAEFSVAPQQKASPPIKFIAIAGGSALVIFVCVLFWVRSSLPKPAAAPADTASASAAPAVAPRPAASLLTGPGPIATAEDLSKSWSAKRFLFRNALTGQTEPAMVVRLPRGELWGFSLLEPFGNCELEFVTDLDKIRTDYRYKADHPMVVDPCNHTVYDLLRYGGGAANDELVRGVIVQGTGIRPPMAIEIRAEGKDIVAVREE